MHRLQIRRPAHELLGQVMGLVADGKLKPVIHKAFPLAQAAEAHRVVDSRDFFGKVVLVP